MNLLIICKNEPWECIPATCLIRRFQNDYRNLSLSWMANQDTECLFRFNNGIKKLYSESVVVRDKFDLAINLTPSEESCKIMRQTVATEKLGFSWDNEIVCLNEGASNYLKVFNKEKTTKRNYMQILFKVANMSWKGEGYDLAYYPRNKVKKRKTGIAIADRSLREFVKENLRLQYSDIWHVPMRKDYLKRIDEINRVNQIITDDNFCLHAGIALRKHVEFIDIQGMNMGIEFFGKGNYYKLNSD